MNIQVQNKHCRSLWTHWITLTITHTSWLCVFFPRKCTISCNAKYMSWWRHVYVSLKAILGQLSTNLRCMTVRCLYSEKRFREYGWYKLCNICSI